MDKGQRGRTHSVRVLGVVVVVLTLATTWIRGYEQYSQNGDLTNCAACHGDFRNNFYTELGLDGGFWLNGLHSSHQDFVEGQCDTCHQASGRFPVLLDNSAGAPGLSPISCTGCHGRDADSVDPGNPAVTVGAGAGLRQHHWNADADHPTMNLKICADCHDDADPATFTPTGENVLPTYYAEAGAAYPLLPADPCDATAPLEDQYGSTSGGPDGRGTDNDGDLVYDGADSDCSVAAGSPGEAASTLVEPLLVTAHDAGAGTLSLSYGTACSTTDNSLVWGNLGFDGVPTYDYTGQICSIGNGGVLSGWVYPAQSFFFLVVANDGASIEGSYGTDSFNAERGVDAACGLTQDLANRCD